jgi:hypothetical protein
MIIAGIPNVMQGGICSVGGADGGNHADQEPSSYSTAASNLPSASTFLVQSRAVLEQVNFVAIVNHNLDKQKGSYWRVWADSKAPSSSNAIVGTQELYPTSRDASSNLTGTYSAIDDNPFLSASESDYITFGASSYGTFGFGTPTDDPAQQAGNEHAIVLRGNATGLKVTVIPGGVGTTTVLCDGETIGDEDPLARRVLILPFGTGILDPDLSTFQVKVEADNGSRIYSLMWSHGYYATGTMPQFDSGWMLIAGESSTTQLVAPSPWLNKYEKQQTDICYIDADGVIHKTIGATGQGFAEYGTWIAAPDVVGDAAYVYVSFLNAATDDRLNRLGVLAAGQFYQVPAERNFTGLSFGIEDASKKVMTFGGQELPSNRHRRRKATFTLPRVTRLDMAALAERIDIAKGVTGAFLVAFYPEDDAAFLSDLMTFWCTQDEAMQGAWVHSPMSVVNDEDSAPFRFDRTYSVKEKI